MFGLAASAAHNAHASRSMARQQEAYNLYMHRKYMYGDRFVGMRGDKAIVSGKTNIPAVPKIDHKTRT